MHNLLKTVSVIENSCIPCSGVLRDMIYPAYVSERMNKCMKALSNSILFSTKEIQETANDRECILFSREIDYRK